MRAISNQAVFSWKYKLTRIGQAKKQISVKAFSNYAVCRWQQQ